MRKYADNIAGKEEVLERAKANLEKEHGIELSEEEMGELYDITTKYIGKKLKEEYWGAVSLSGLGTAYYNIYYCNKMKFRAKTSTNKTTRKSFERWESLFNRIEDHYQSNQTGVNAKKSYKFFHVINPMLKRANRKGYKMDDIEKVQNKIE